MAKRPTDARIAERLLALQSELAACEEAALAHRATAKEQERLAVQKEREARMLASEAQTLSVIRFVRDALQPTFLSRRAKFLKKVSRAHSEDITVKEKRALEEELDAELHALQDTCAHPFVFSYDGYGGSRAMDFDDAHPERRLCACCRFEEYSLSYGKKQFSTLVENGERVIRRDLRRDKHESSVAFVEWFSAGSLRKLFEDSAASNNLEWAPDLESPIVR